MRAGNNKKEEKVLQFPSNLEEDNLIMQKGFSGHVPKNLFEDFEMPPSSADCGLWGFFCFVFFPPLPNLYWASQADSRRGAGSQTFELKLHSYLKMYGLYECMTYISQANK